MGHCAVAAQPAGFQRSTAVRRQKVLQANPESATPSTSPESNTQRQCAGALRSSCVGRELVEDENGLLSSSASA